MDLSIVIPIYNEERSVRPLCEAIVRSVEPLGLAFETLLVDDGSTDGTFDQALEVARHDTRFRIIKLRKNFGQTAALYAGFEQARGTIIITMDGDLQNDPEDIEQFIQKMREGNDMVLGWRENRQDRWISRKIPSMAANWLIRKVTGAPIKDNGCALRAYRADVIKKFPLYSEMHRLLPTILALSGARITQIKVRHHPRKYGSSKYGLSRVYKVLFDLVALKSIMTSYGTPLFGYGSFALAFGALSALAFLASVVHVITHPASSVVVYLGVSMLAGILSIALLMLGMLCALVYAKGNLKVETLLKVDMI